MTRKLKIFFYMLDFIGPQNACIGLGQVMIERGHQVYFLVNEKFGDKFSKYGFEVRFLKEDQSRSKQDDNVDPIKQFCNELIENGFFDNLSSLEKLKRFKKSNFFEEIYLKNLDFEPQLKVLLEEEKPDFLVVDSDIVAPCLINSKIPWTYLFCSQPVGFFNSPELPPFTSGYPVKGDRTQWQKFRKVQQEVHFDEILKYQKSLCEKYDYPFNENQKFLPHSPYLNIYQYPEELDYQNDITIPDNFLRVDAFCRKELGQFKLPDEFASKIKPGDKLIYLSMGSMGSVDVKLMARLVSILANTPHWYIVSKGLLHEQYELADNMWGDVYVPQTQILPLVDLVITHGGNNSVTEAFSFGKPMIVLPLFYDQFDNAQRLTETGFGLRLETYEFEDKQLIDAIEQLLTDQTLKQRLDNVVQRIANTNSKLRACLAIEKVAEKAD